MDFIRFAASHGIEIERLYPADGIRRCPTTTHPHKKNGAYFFDGRRGFVWNWETGGGVQWWNDPNSRGWSEQEVEGLLLDRHVIAHRASSGRKLDGFIMYPPATARFESELKKAVAADVRAVMTPNPTTIAADAPVEDAATLLVERDVSRLPVLDGDKLVGIVSKSDVVRSLLVDE